MTGKSGEKTAAKAAKKRRKRYRVSFFSRMCIVAAAAVLFAVLITQGLKLRQEGRANEQTAAELNDQLEEEKARTSQIEGLRDYYSSEEYVRQTAKDKLGLIDDGEIVFKPEE